MSSYIAGRRYPNSISLKFGLNYTCGVLRSFKLIQQRIKKGVKEHVASASEARKYMLDPLHGPWTRFVQASLPSSPGVFEHKYILHLLEKQTRGEHPPTFTIHII